MISVIAAIYNEEAYIPRCIESILQQTYPDLQILLIDDGSTDRSGKICDEYADRDCRCTVIHQENKGIASARNTGLQHATGEYVMFVDGDDYIHPRCCETLRNAAVECQCPLAIADARRVSGHISSIELAADATPRPIILTQDELMRRLFTLSPRKYHTDVMVWGKLYRRDLLDGLFFRDVVGEDIEYNSRILPEVSKGAFVDAALYYWVQRHTSISMQPFSRRNIDELNVWTICLDNLPANETRYRGYVLLRLYKNILNIKYITSKELKPCVRETTSRLVGETIAEFRQNKYLTWGQKSILLLLYRIPPLYAAFRKIAGKTAGITRLCTLNRTKND